MSLLDDLKQAASPAPSGFKPGIVFQGAVPVEVTTPPLPALDGAEDFDKAVRELGYPIPEGYTLQLVEMQLVQHEAAWTRENQGDDATTKPTSSFRYRFKVVPKDSIVDREDLGKLMEEARKAPKYVEREDGGGTLVVALADFQTGKAQDSRGGTPALLARSEQALSAVIAKIKDRRYNRVVLLDAGDSVEGFESSPNADRTNDLSQTEQIRVWRRILWRWVSAIAPLVNGVTVAGVPSNHCRVRRGKQTMGDALDDWGVEVIAQVRDIAEASDAYDHVAFVIPGVNTEHVLLPVEDLTLGVIHGHQVNNPNQLPDMIKKNARRGIGQADVIVAGHFHHLRVINMGHEQTLFVCPANDAGSSWFQYSGESSRAGVLTFEVYGNEWRGLDVIWTS